MTRPTLPWMYFGIRSDPLASLGLTTTESPILNFIPFFGIIPSLSVFLGRGAERFADSDQALPGYEFAQLLLAQLGSPLGPLRQNHVPDIRGTIVHQDLLLWRNSKLEHLFERVSWICDYPRLVSILLVPPRRVAEKIIRITGTKCAHDNVVNRIVVFDNVKLPQSARGNPKFPDRFPRVGEQPLLEGWISPGPRDDLGPVEQRWILGGVVQPLRDLWIKEPLALKSKRDGIKNPSVIV